MRRESRQQLTKQLQKHLLQDRPEAEILAGLVERHLPRQGSSKQLLAELIDGLMVIRQQCKQGAATSRSLMVELLPAFQKVAEKKTISSDQFYAALVARIFWGLEGEEELKQQVKLSTKERILNAAMIVFAEKGFHLTTVDEIAEAAGVGKGTLYRYFANKETLFSELIRLRLEELEQSAQAILDGQDDVLTMITKYVRIYFEFFDRHQSLYRLIVQERLDVGKQVQDVYFKKVMRSIPLLKRKIYEASQRGVLKDVDFQTVFYGVMGFIHGVIQKWLARDCSYSLMDELPTVMEVLFHGFVKEEC